MILINTCHVCGNATFDYIKTDDWQFNFRCKKCRNAIDLTQMGTIVSTELSPENLAQAVSDAILSMQPEEPPVNVREAIAKCAADINTFLNDCFVHAEDRRTEAMNKLIAELLRTYGKPIVDAVIAFTALELSFSSNLAIRPNLDVIRWARTVSIPEVKIDLVAWRNGNNTTMFNIVSYHYVCLLQSEIDPTA